MNNAVVRKLTTPSGAVRQLGRTRAMPASADPVWVSPPERFVVPVGMSDLAECDLTLEIWDRDDLEQGDFLGQV